MDLDRNETRKGEYLSEDSRGELLDLIFKKVEEKLREKRKLAKERGENLTRGRIPVIKAVASELGIKANTVKAWKLNKWNPDTSIFDTLFNKAWELDPIETQNILIKNRTRSDLLFGATMDINREPMSRLHFFGNREGNIVSLNFTEMDFRPYANNNLINVCGSEINPKSMIFSDADSFSVVESYQKLSSFTKITELMPLLVHFDYVQFLLGFTPMIQYWVSPLKLAFWYERCEKQKIKNIDVKGNELKKKINGLARNIVKKKDNKDYFNYLKEIEKQIISLKNEFMDASLIHDIVSNIKFGDKSNMPDLFINSIPAEVKTLTAKATIDNSSGKPVLKLDGMELDNGSSLLEAFVNGLDVLKRRSDHHREKSEKQNAKLIILNASPTFLGMVMGMAHALDISEMSLEKAVNQALQAFRKGAEMGIIVISEFAGYRQAISALCIV